MSFLIPIQNNVLWWLWDTESNLLLCWHLSLFLNSVSPTLSASGLWSWIGIPFPIQLILSFHPPIYPSIASICCRRRCHNHLTRKTKQHEALSLSFVLKKYLHKTRTGTLNLVLLIWFYFFSVAKFFVCVFRCVCTRLGHTNGKKLALCPSIQLFVSPCTCLCVIRNNLSLEGFISSVPLWHKPCY